MSRNITHVHTKTKLISKYMHRKNNPEINNSQKSLPLFDIIKRGQCLPKSGSSGEVGGGGGAEEGAQAANGGPEGGSG